MLEYRWRSLPDLDDESWVYEEKAEGEETWALLASVWEMGFPEGWRLLIEPDTPEAPRIDRLTLAEAKEYVEDFLRT